MALEDLTGTDKFVDDFIKTNPTGTDPKNQGDDHIRGIKNVLLNQFPNLTAAVTSDATELNLLDGRSMASSGLVIDNFPTGTAMLFPQAAAPVGWTQSVTYDNHMLRVIATAGGGTGGTDSPILNNKVPSHNHTFTTDSGGAHTHTFDAGRGGTGAPEYAPSLLSQVKDRTWPVNSGGTHTHTGTSNANGSASNWAPKYIDTLVATKDAP